MNDIFSTHSLALLTLTIVFGGLFLVNLLPSLVGAFYSNLGSMELSKGLPAGLNEAVSGFDLAHGEHKGGEENLEHAWRFFSQARFWQPGAPRVYQHLGEVYMRQGCYTEATDALARALQLAPGDRLASLEMGNAYYAMGQDDKTIESWRSANAGYYLIRQASHYSQQWEPWTTLEIIELALQVDPSLSLPPNAELSRIYGDLGAILERKSDPDTAIQVYEKAIRYDPTRPGYNVSLALLYLQQGKRLEAMRQLEIAAGSEDSLWRARAYAEIGNLFHGAGQFTDAIAAYRKALEADPRPGYRVSLALVYRDMGLHDQALVELTEATKTEESLWRARAYAEIGNLLNAAGQLTDAIQAYKRALEADPRPGYRVSLALVYRDMSLYDQAIEELTLATETDHSIWRATAYFELGRLYQELGRLEEAIDAYEMAVASSSSNVTYRLGLANAYVAADRLEDALRELEAALSLQPDNPSAKADYEHLRQKMEK